MNTEKEYRVFYNKNGPRITCLLGNMIEKDGLFFKDHEKNGQLLPYEDWRLDAQKRAEDLAARLSIEEIAGLMLQTSHQSVPSLFNFAGESTYDGKPYYESGKAPWEITDQQKKYIEEEHIRHLLAAEFESTESAVLWHNELQKLAEKQPHGIPICLSSDPRNNVSGDGQEFKVGANAASIWPEGLGMAATFSPELCEKYAQIISREYRALGICMSLSPQADLGTEPRWMRIEDTFGCHPILVTEMIKAYCSGMQTTPESKDGWGKLSVGTIVKHWPGGGTGESGRDAHYPFGKYAVYPGEQFKLHLTPFINGAFSLDSVTEQAAAVMPYYTVSWNQDEKNNENVGNAYSEYLISDLLREKYGYDGIICTDWVITEDPKPIMDSFGSRCYGMEEKNEAERHLRLIENGIDQFGGNDSISPILQAYRLGCEKHGAVVMRKRMEQSAVRILKHMFRCGLFEDPYLDLKESQKTVGSRDAKAAGYEAQLKSIVMIKNQQALPICGRHKVYIPTRFIKPGKSFIRTPEAERWVDPVPKHMIYENYERVENPQDADFAVVFIESPLSDGYKPEEDIENGNGYFPITLQYRPYKASEARKVSIAGGDFRESFKNRSYIDKWNTARNEYDLDLVIKTKEQMKERPVIVCIRMHNPAVLSELEPYADAILVDFGVEKRALFDVIAGRFEPFGRLPVQLPESMETVEKHCEDMPLDLKPYKDTQGNYYDFGFGLNWQGQITDPGASPNIKKLLTMVNKL